MIIVVGVLMVEGGLILAGMSILIPLEGAILTIAGATALTYASTGLGMKSLESLKQNALTFFLKPAETKKRLVTNGGEGNK
jgi:hypothetical protein